MESDIRWEQRFSNFRKVLKKLSDAVLYIKNEIDEKEIEIQNDKDSKDVLNEIVKEGLIQRFEYTFELAWNVMKDYALYQGNSELTGSRDAIRYAFSTNLINDGDMWMDMMKSRIMTSHTYNEETTNDIYLKIVNEYYDAFQDFEKVMEEKQTGSQQDFFDRK